MYVVLGQGAEEEERASVDLVAAGAGIHQHGQGEFAFPSLNSILYQNEPWVTTPRKGGRVWWTLLPFSNRSDLLIVLHGSLPKLADPKKVCEWPVCMASGRLKQFRGGELIYDAVCITIFS